jgi:alkanesulfonate monooxygenase SsuD/methylene tetrahydromethanopterin reductase-like flavin-dependent oxidoreductase (luciferase family)
VPPPLVSAAEIRSRYEPQLLATVDEALSCAAVGSVETVRARLSEFIARHQPDELILTANIHDPAARLRSFELAMTAAQGD